MIECYYTGKSSYMYVVIEIVNFFIRKSVLVTDKVKK